MKSPSENVISPSGTDPAPHSPQPSSTNSPLLASTTPPIAPSALPSVTPNTIDPPPSIDNLPTPYAPTANVAPPNSFHRDGLNMDNIAFHWKSTYYAKIYYHLFQHLSSDDFQLFRQGQWPSSYTCEDNTILPIITYMVRTFEQDVLVPCEIPFAYSSTTCQTTFLQQNILLTIMSFFDYTIGAYNWSNKDAKVFSLQEIYADYIITQLFDRISSSLRLSVGGGFLNGG